VDVKKAKSRLNGSPPTKNRSRKLLKRYLTHFSTIFTSAAFFIIFGYIITNVYPNYIQHFLFPNSYFGLVLSFFLGLFFLAAYILLSTRRGLLVATAASIFLYLKLLQVQLKPEVVLAILTWFGILEVLLTWFSNIKVLSRPPAKSK
jgi:hypothetical protein